MTVSASALAVLVGIALAITVIAPVLLLALFIRDCKQGDLW